MSFRSFIVSFPFLWSCATGRPAYSNGPKFPDNVTSPVDEFHVDAAALSLIDTYDSSNWLSKFDVQAVRIPIHPYSLLLTFL